MSITLPNNNDLNYYAGAGDHGEYQYVNVSDIKAAFKATYIGSGKICQGVLHTDVDYWANRAVQELSYDTLKSINAQEIVVPPSLTMILPRDYVNYVKLTWTDNSGLEHTIMPMQNSSNPTKIDQNTDGSYKFVGNDLSTTETSTTLTNFQTFDPSEDVDDYPDYNEETFFALNSGERYGMEPSFANGNGRYIIDNLNGKIHFSSHLSGETVILKYISDGVGVDANDRKVHKFAEEAVLKYMLYGCLQARLDTPPQLLANIKKERFAEIRKAKIRLSNFKIEEIAQIMRGKSKQIKH